MSKSMGPKPTLCQVNNPARFWLFWASKAEITAVKVKAGARSRRPNVVLNRVKYTQN